MKPDIYPGMSWPEYEQINAAHSSLLRLFGRSPAHVREAMLHPPEPTAAMDFGQAVHAAVLEPDRFAADYCAGPVGDRRTKAVKAAWEALERERPAATIMRPADYETCMAMQAAAWRNPTVKALLSGAGMNEVAVVWNDAAAGVLCKARIDRFTEHAGWSVIVDLKTTANAGSGAFSKALYDYGYYIQAAFYRAGLEALSPRGRKVMLVAIEKERPYASAVYQVDSSALQQGAEMCERYLARYAECMERDEWPSYPVEPQVLTLPAWAVARGLEEVA